MKYQGGGDFWLPLLSYVGEFHPQEEIGKLTTNFATTI
jgi:hypothetical protein